MNVENAAPAHLKSAASNLCSVENLHNAVLSQIVNPCTYTKAYLYLESVYYLASAGAEKSRQTCHAGGGVIIWRRSNCHSNLLPRHFIIYFVQLNLSMIPYVFFCFEARECLKEVILAMQRDSDSVMLCPFEAG